MEGYYTKKVNLQIASPNTGTSMGNMAEMGLAYLKVFLVRFRMTRKD